MNTNIVKILKDYPKGTKLYSPLLGDVTLEEINITFEFPIIVKSSKNSCSAFSKTGLYYNYENAECLLFPSSEMRDWTKFFKRGDILVNGDIIVLFEGWVDSSYKRFKTSLFIWDSINKGYSKKTTYNVEYFQRVSKAQQEYFIKKIEAFYNGKYNPITLQVEPVKPACPFKPFDKVLVRDNKEHEWHANFFSHYMNGKDFPYACCFGNAYRFCIPYEGNEHLLGKV